MGNPRSTEKLLDHCGSKAEITAEAQHAWELVGIGVDPGCGYFQQRRGLFCLKQAFKAAEPLFDCAATKAIVATESFKSWDLMSVPTNPGHSRAQNAR